MNAEKTKVEKKSLTVAAGAPTPLGSVQRDGYVQFALYTRYGSRVWLALFDHAEDSTPSHEFELSALEHRSGHVWSVRVYGLRAGALYAYRVDGPRDPKRGQLYDASKYLVDPYGRVVVNNTGTGFPKTMVVEGGAVTGLQPRPSWPMNDTIIYETHVKGFTYHESAAVRRPGTYAGFAEKLDYLKDLGVTAIELLPVQECGETRIHRRNPETGEYLSNYWGYNPLNFFAPAGRFASDAGQTGKQVSEFQALVESCHAHGLEVILDVVMNHTSEGGRNGPTQSFRGFDNTLYYLVDEHGAYRDFSGCGNTVNCNQPVVSDLVIESLRCWLRTMNVDGFRFDLASILNRDQHGDLHHNAPLVQRISEDSVLQGVKLIAEAWDVGGAYQVGHFGTSRWADWNGRYRDDVRRYWRNDPGSKADFALRLTGSPDLYQVNGRTPQNSINFVTAHDGFTLRDLVSYNHKHNHANGENNRDGSNHDISWNCGVEGPTDEPEVNELRMRVQKGFLATLFLSLGTPMMLGGDEMGRTQWGNNNAYCQDNLLSWYDWRFLEEYRELHRFCREMIRFRKQNPVLRRTTFFTGQPCHSDGVPDLAWYAPNGQQLDWGRPDLCLACQFHQSQNEGVSLYCMFNPTLVAREFRIPPGIWKVRVNTARPSPAEFNTPEDAPEARGKERFVLGRKALAILARTVQ